MHYKSNRAYILDNSSMCIIQSSGVLPIHNNSIYTIDSNQVHTRGTVESSTACRIHSSTMFNKQKIIKTYITHTRKQNCIQATDITRSSRKHYSV